MDETLWSEKTCCSLIPDLPLWIIEYAWSNRLTDVLEVLGPPLWLTGDWSCLSLKDPCSIRVVAAEAWMVVRARDIKHFERVMELLGVIYTLLPQLVTSIKHMKIMFGLKTLVIMWMLWDNQSVARITEKIQRFFPEKLSQYRRSSRKHVELMEKAQQDFRSFALTLAQNTDMRKTYIRDLLEEQYGEPYALKLEERLIHYLEVLDKALPQPTCIDQILKKSCPLGEREELLQQLLTINTTSLPTVLKRLLRCAMATHFSQGDAEMCRQENEAEADRPVLGPTSGHLCVAFKPSQERAEEEGLSQTCSQGSWLSRDKRPSLVQKDRQKIYVNRQEMVLKQKPDLRLESSADMDPCVVEEQGLQRVEQEQKEAKDVTTEQLCSRHGRKMKSILLECSEELSIQERQAPLAHSEGTPSSPLTPLLQSTPQTRTRSSASPLQDSSSTNISLSSSLDSSSTNISGFEVRKISSLQPSSGTVSSTASPAQQNSSNTSAVQHLNISAASMFSEEQVLPILSPSPPFHQITPSPVQFSLQPFISRTSSSLPTASSTVQQGSLSPMFSLQPPLSQTPSSSTNLSSFSGNHITFSSEPTAHDVSRLPPASSAVRQESAPLMFSVYKNLASGGQQPCSSLNSLSLAVPITSHNSEHIPGTISQDVDAVSESNSFMRGTLKLSLETQGFFLLCKWLQPQVMLYRLNQQEFLGAALPEGAQDSSSEEEEVDEEEENESFDVNLLYSDSELDTEDSSDPDFVP